MPAKKEVCQDHVRQAPASVTFAEVLLPLPIPAPLLYRVPAALQEEVTIGSRVEVICGAQALYGVVVRLSGEADGEGCPAALQPQRAADPASPPAALAIREVLSVGERTPLLAPSQLEWIAWVGRYYLVPPGMLLKKLLQPVAAHKLAELPMPPPVKMVKLHPPVAAAGSEPAIQLSPRQQRALDYLSATWQERGAPPSGLPAHAIPRTAVSAQLLGSLQKKGYLSVYHAPFLPPDISDVLQKSGQTASPARRAGESNPFPASLLPPDHPGTPAAADKGWDRLSAAWAEKQVVFQPLCHPGHAEAYEPLLCHAAAAGKKVMVLVPHEAALRRLCDGLPRWQDRWLLWHPRQTSAQRIAAWQKVRHGQYSLLIGLPGALTLPLQGLDYLVIHEEESPSYHVRWRRLGFQARSSAIQLACLSGARVMLSGLTPSLETVYQLRQGRYALLPGLSCPARQTPITLHEWPEAARPSSPPGMSAPLPLPFTAWVTAAMAQQKRVVVLQPGKGYGQFLFCPACQWESRCPDCGGAYSLTKGLPFPMRRTERDESFYFGNRSRRPEEASALQCSFCRHTAPQPPCCPVCKAGLTWLGSGIAHLPEKLAAAFPGRHIRTFSSGRSGAEEELLQADLLVASPAVLELLPSLAGCWVCGIEPLGWYHPLNFRAEAWLYQQMRVLTHIGAEQLAFFFPARQRHSMRTLKLRLEQLTPLAYSSALLKEREELSYPPFRGCIKVFVSHAQVQEAYQAALFLLEQLGQQGFLAQGPSPAGLTQRPAHQPRYALWLFLAEEMEKERLLALVETLHFLPGLGKVAIELEVDS